MIIKFKLFEKIDNTEFFKNEKHIKDLLLEDEDFAEGDVHQALMNIIYKDYDINNKDYEYQRMLTYTFENFGILPEFAILLGKYNYQVGNGGHSQYYENGYAGNHKERLDIHENFVQLFQDLDMTNILSSGKLAYDIIDDFELEYDEDIENCSFCGGSGEEECSTCSGNGEVDCSECDGTGEIEEDEEFVPCSNCDASGRIPCDECEGNGHTTCSACDGTGNTEVEIDQPITTEWSKLDDKWYLIDDDIMEQFNNYLKSLNLDGEKMTDLIALADHYQKYNL